MRILGIDPVLPGGYGLIDTASPQSLVDCGIDPEPLRPARGRSARGDRLGISLIVRALCVRQLASVEKFFFLIAPAPPFQFC